MKQISGCVGKLNVADINGSSTSTALQIANQLFTQPTFVSNLTDRTCTGEVPKVAMSGHYISSSG